MTSLSAHPEPRPVMTVRGPVQFEQLGITDAHNHVWIEPVPGADPDSPVLNQFDLIRKELIEYRENHGESLLDCQPGGSGRNGNQLLALSRASGVNLIACTGFHLKKYYPEDYWLWAASAQKVSQYLCSELEVGLQETLESPSPVKAGFIKIALQADWKSCPQAALEGAAAAALKAKALLLIHTEKGSLAEKACIFFSDRGVPAHQLVLCHMDKRPDISLHKELANLGVLLEYDTFFRPKYSPDENLWPLINQMTGAGFSDRLAFATDMAEADHYHHIGNGPGLKSLTVEIQEKLIEMGYPENTRKQMLGGNITRRLAGLI